MKLWSLSSLLAVGVLVAACAGSDPPKEDPATSISQLPLSAKCSTCAQSALSGKCSAQLQTCSQNPSCLDVDSCLVACDPKDVACFSDCAKASAQFNDLTACVFCDSCSAECSGEWQCGANPKPQPTACDKSGDCASCGKCAIQNECQPQFDQCTATSECGDLAKCVLDCNGDAKCAAVCEAQFPNGVKAFEPLAECVSCQACPADCAAQAQGCAPSPSPGTCDGSGNCAKCVACAEKAACTKEFESCSKEPECSAALDCVASCGTMSSDCVEVCLQTSKANPQIEAVASCLVCDECSSDCNAKAWGCAP